VLVLVLLVCVLFLFLNLGAPKCLQNVVYVIIATTITTTTGLVSVLVCAAVLFAATTNDEGDAKLLTKIAKMRIVNGKTFSKVFHIVSR
jgi:hypothetical protein